MVSLKFIQILLAKHWESQHLRPACWVCDSVLYFCVYFAVGWSVLLLLFMCWTASVTDVSPLQCVVMYHTSCVLELPTPLQNALWCWRCCYVEPFELTLHTCNMFTYIFIQNHILFITGLSLLWVCVWFAASYTTVNSLHHQFVTFFPTLSLSRFVYNESAIMDE